MVVMVVPIGVVRMAMYQRHMPVAMCVRLGYSHSGFV